MVGTVEDTNAKSADTDESSDEEGDDWSTCSLCKTSFTNRKEYQTHLRSMIHVQRQMLSNSGAADKESFKPIEDERPTSYDTWKYCQYCHSSFKTLQEYNDHINSDEHLKREASSKESSARSGLLRKTNDWKWCDGCNQPFKSEEAYLTHCTTSGHLQREKAAAMKSEKGKAQPVAFVKKRKGAGSCNEDQYEVVPVEDLPVDADKPPASMGYFCELCDVSCSSDTTFQTHLDGKRHKKALEKKVTTVELPPNRNLFRLGESLPGDSAIQPAIDQYAQGTIIGAGDLVEYVHKDLPEPIYVCELCDVKADPRTIFPHLIGLKHRMKFFKSNYRYNDYNTSLSIVKERSRQTELAEKYAKIIRGKKGPGIVKRRYGIPMTKDKDAEENAKGSRDWNDIRENRDGRYDRDRDRRPDSDIGQKSDYRRSSFDRDGRDRGSLERSSPYGVRSDDRENDHLRDRRPESRSPTGHDSLSVPKIKGSHWVRPGSSTDIDRRAKAMIQMLNDLKKEKKEKESKAVMNSSSIKRITKSPIRVGGSSFAGSTNADPGLKNLPPPAAPGGITGCASSYAFPPPASLPFVPPQAPPVGVPSVPPIPFPSSLFGFPDPTFGSLPPALGAGMPFVPSLSLVPPVTPFPSLTVPPPASSCIGSRDPTLHNEAGAVAGTSTEAVISKVRSEAMDWDALRKSLRDGRRKSEGSSEAKRARHDHRRVEAPHREAVEADDVATLLSTLRSKCSPSSNPLFNTLLERLGSRQPPLLRTPDPPPKPVSPKASPDVSGDILKILVSKLSGDTVKSDEDAEMAQELCDALTKSMLKYKLNKVLGNN